MAEQEKENHKFHTCVDEYIETASEKLEGLMAVWDSDKLRCDEVKSFKLKLKKYDVESWTTEGITLEKLVDLIEEFCTEAVATLHENEN